MSYRACCCPHAHLPGVCADGPQHLPPEAYGRKRVPRDDVAEGVRARFLTMVGEVS